MRGYNVTKELLERCAAQVGVVLFNVSKINRKGTSWQFTLRPDRRQMVPCQGCGSEPQTKHEKWCDYKRCAPFLKWQAKSRSLWRERRVFAVCWHGHQAFFR